MAETISHDCIMADSRINKIQDILTEVDLILRERLKRLGVEIRHLLLAIAPGGTGIVRSNVGPAVLGDIADMLAEIADDAYPQRTDDESLH